MCRCGGRANQHVPWDTEAVIGYRELRQRFETPVRACVCARVFVSVCVDSKCMFMYTFVFM